jgi:hypothetical protein
MEFLTTIEKINKRASAKFSQSFLMDAMIGLNSRYQNRYIDTLNCSELIYRENGKLKSRYCRNRWCKICNRIRTGILINGYSQALEEMPDKQFVTLTIKNVPAENLRTSIKEMLKTCRKIQETRRKRDKLSGINAIRKLECTYNAEKNNFHPHFHFIVSSREEAEYLKNAWIRYYPEVNEKGQDIREAYKPAELFKYFTKLTSKTATQERKYKTGKIRITDENMYPEAIDTIFQAIEKIRIVQPMGKIKLVKDEIEELQAETIDETVSQEDADTFYLWAETYWYSPYTGVILSSFKPTKKNFNFAKRIRYLTRDPVT